MLDYMELKSRSKATSYHVKNVKQWLENANNPIREEEVAFLQEEDDLIPVVSTRKVPVRNFINRFNPLGLAGIGNRKVRRQRNPPQPVIC